MNIKPLAKMSFELILVILIMGCAGKPSVSVVARQGADNISFDIRTAGINGLISLRIWQADTREVIWQIDLNSFGGGRLDYGQIPKGFITLNGGMGDAKQSVPSGEVRPEPLRAGKSYFLALEAQYDTMTSAAARLFLFSFSTDVHGRISPIEPVSAQAPRTN